MIETFRTSDSPKAIQMRAANLRKRGNQLAADLDARMDQLANAVPCTETGWAWRAVADDAITHSILRGDIAQATNTTDDHTDAAMARQRTRYCITQVWTIAPVAAA